MNTADLIARTQAYVEASNDHDVERIAGMLADDASYSSSGVGEHEGAAAILAMNTTFFDANPDVHWQPENFRAVGDDGVAFDFVITIGGQPSSGVERVYFHPDGRIRRVEVER